MARTISKSVGRKGANQFADAKTIQELLNANIGKLIPLAPLDTDGRVGPATIGAIEEFQRRVLKMNQPDGRVDPGGRTLSALNGAPVGPGPAPKPTPSGPTGDTSFPPKPAFGPLGGDAAKQKLFGKFEYEHDPKPDNKENIKVLGNWASKNITTVSIDMGPNVGTRKVQFHKSATKQLQEMWAAWKDAGLLDRVKSYAGSYVPRFIRGSTTVLSQHAFGTAFDINVPWNGLGKTPALVGKEGSVRELVPIANQFGFYWGGHFTRLDGMHFEVAQIK